MSLNDAVDGSSTRHVSAMDVGAAKAPTIRGAKNASDHDNRSGYSEISLSSSRRRCGGQRCVASPAQATLRVGVLPEAVVLPSRHRSLRVVTSLVTRAPGAWPHCTPDAAGLR